MALPACVLVVLVLASVAVDMSLVHLRHRQALDAAASAADDAVTAGADRSALRSGSYRLDPASAEAVSRATVARSGIAGDLTGEPVVVIDGDTVEVTLQVEVDRLFAGAVPGAEGSTVVTASAAATAHEL